jgi:hypothetical protein
MKIVDYGHVTGYGRKDRLFSLAGIRRQMNARIRLPSSSIVQESVEKCEVVHI